MSSDPVNSNNQAMTEMKKFYSETVIDHAMHPRNLGEFPKADGFSSITGSCGDTMEIWLKITNNKINKAMFLTDGCAATIACGSMITEMITGKEILEAQKISQDDLLAALDGLPKNNEHCALLATITVKEAIKDYLSIKNNPWKKVYR